LKFTYKECLIHTAQMATMLKDKFKVKKGDRVLIYMPMVPQAAFAMLACARIGAIHSVVFGGFAAKELASRVDDCLPKLIITCSVGLEPNKVIQYTPIVDEALKICTVMKNATSLPRLIFQRKEKPEYFANSLSKHYIDYERLRDSKKWAEAPCVSLPTNHELYILYTSGTTGTPKGIVRGQGDTCVGLSYSMKNIFDIRTGDVHFAASDIGWVVGHSYIVYGPLIACAKTVFFEGKPIVPDAGIIWKICQEYKVKSLYMAPTGVRVIKKEDYDGELMKKYNTSSIKIF